MSLDVKCSQAILLLDRALAVLEPIKDERVQRILRELNYALLDLSAIAGEEEE